MPDPLPLELSTNDFTQNDFGINVAQWEFSGRSRFSGFLAYTQRSYPRFAQRDFSGPTWNLTYIYLPTTSTTINLSFYRLIGLYTDVTTNYIQTTGVTLNPTWQATGKLGFGLIASYQNRDYKGDPGILTTVVWEEKREDKLTMVDLERYVRHSSNGEGHSLLHLAEARLEYSALRLYGQHCGRRGGVDFLGCIREHDNHSRRAKAEEITRCLT